ncbi:hypothetical protein LPJ61_001579 [Coemansia biformis]|uniref:Uncharacterized protein n=1 Tax=Coemansia biformis TaxID=1286918 RepID=A0A9W8CXZ2_9FUNG|nr:hypothetical protein LPJ61_001579 [Coemansia biformis]
MAPRIFTPASQNVVSSSRVNPVCRRMLQRLADEKKWKLDESAQFSIDNWTNIINQDNILLFLRGMRVPCPPGDKFKARLETFRVSIGFWTPFQQRMWDYFLSHDTGPCYLDAAYRPGTDGFQIWTLFFERSGQTVPVSYLVTTAATVGLVSDWLTAIVDQSPELLPKKTIFINTLRATSALEAIFGTWDVRLCKYYVDQVLKDALRQRAQAVGDPRAVSAIQDVDKDLFGTLEEALATPAIKHKVEFLFRQAQDWKPRNEEEDLAFGRGSQAVARWRYLLWTQMLGRPATKRIDSVLYHLVSVLSPGVERAVRAHEDGAEGPGDFCTEGFEQGSKSLTMDLANVTIVPLGTSLVYLANYSSLEDSHVIAPGYNVCFCRRFADHGLCPHLIYWATPAIHQPELVRILDGLPHA